MNARFIMVLVLTLVTTISGAGLALWDQFTAPMIAKNLLHELEEGIARVLPAHDRYETIESSGTTFYVGYKEGEETPVGICFETAGPGFQGKIKLMVGLKPDFEEITGIEIIGQIETPGLGTKIVEDRSNKADRYWFPNQFKGLIMTQAIETRKNKKPETKHQIEAITGATISSRAVAKIVSDGVKNARTAWNQREN